MKVERVKVGDRFVVDDRGGVWERIEDNPGSAVGTIDARCVFGSREIFGTETSFDQNAYCLVIKDGKHFHPRETEPNTKTTRVIVIEEWNDTIVKEMGRLTHEQISVMSSSDTIRITPQGKNDSCVYMVSELAYDMDDGVLYVLVIPERDGGNDDQDENKEERQVLLISLFNN